MIFGAGPPFRVVSNRTKNVKNLTGSYIWLGNGNSKTEADLCHGRLRFGWEIMPCVYGMVLSTKIPICINTSSIIITTPIIIPIIYRWILLGPSKCSASNWYPCLFCHFVHLLSHLRSVRPL